jgi:hypothetical protein
VKKGAFVFILFFSNAFQSDWLDLLTPRTQIIPNLFPENYLPTPQWLLLLSPYFHSCQADCLVFVSSEFGAMGRVAQPGEAQAAKLIIDLN